MIEITALFSQNMSMKTQISLFNEAEALADSNAPELNLKQITYKMM